jgi:adenine-specific DNA-methyltransferase
MSQPGITVTTLPPARHERLELCWIGKAHRQVLEPRLLIEDAALSVPGPHARRRRNDGGLTDNRLIFGDNLLALKALEQEFTGKVKCVVIDPPYNTGSAFAHYDDGLEHSIWLTMMRDRLELLRRLLAEDGSLWISIDDNEAHYLKVLCDEIFGRANFVANVVWQKRTSPEARLRLGAAHDSILVYARNAAALSLNKLPLSEGQSRSYTNPDTDPRGAWTSSDFTAQGWRPNQMYRIATPAGVTYTPPQGRCWGNIESVFERLRADNRIWFGVHGRSRPRVKTFLSEQSGISAWTWWSNHEVGHNQEAKKENIALFGAGQTFDTPKPERLIKRILDIATDPGDIVLDSFAGSGTTGAVAHKMGRRWIMIELGEHCRTHVIPRMTKVIAGVDRGGVTEATGWRGGGGFRFFRLAPTILETDRHGREVISRKYNAAMLAEGLCKLHGYRYAPSERIYWQHGRSTEADFIYVTTQTLAQGDLAALAEDVGPRRTLLVICAAFRGTPAAYPNLTLKKLGNIPAECKWDRDGGSAAAVSLRDLPVWRQHTDMLHRELHP